MTERLELNGQTAKEARDAFKGRLKLDKRNRPKAERGFWQRNDRLAIGALELQIPKNIEVDIEQDGRCCFAKTRCPVCGYPIKQKGTRYCAACGQSIRWPE